MSSILRGKIIGKRHQRIIKQVKHILYAWHRKLLAQLVTSLKLKSNKKINVGGVAIMPFVRQGAI